MKMLFTKKILLTTLLFLSLFATTAWAVSPRISWQPEQLTPASVAPGESVALFVTLKHTGILPIPATHQIQVVATGSIAPFITIVPPTFPPVLKRGDEVQVTLYVTVPTGTPLSVEKGTILIQRVLPNSKVKEVFRSEALPVELTFSSVPLPPDPGEAGKADLLGIDADQNGVRDDIDRHIVSAFPDSTKKQEALKQSARSLSTYLRDSEDKAKTRENWATDYEKTLDCLAHVFNDDLDASFKAGDELITQFLNTKERSRAYARANAQMGGYVSNNGPSSERLVRQKAACTFDADSLPN